MIRRRLAGLAVLPLLLLGCGGDDGDGGGEETAAQPEVVSQPEPSESISTRIEAFNEALAERDCERIAPFGHSLTRPTTEPGAPPSAEECRGTESFMADLRGVELEEDAEYGTGAIAEDPPPEGSDAPGTTTVWVVDRDGSYRLLLTADSPPQIDTEVADEEVVEESAGDFVEAVATDDCDAIERLIGPDGRLSAGSPKERCKAIADGELFAPALESTPDPDLELMGGTRSFAFVGVPTEDAYFTIVLGGESVDAEVEPKILDVLPSTELELPGGDDSG